MPDLVQSLLTLSIVQLMKRMNFLTCNSCTCVPTIILISCTYTVHIHVHLGLEFTIVPNSNYTLSDDDILNFTCAVRAPPNTGFNITILWFFNGVNKFSENNVVVVTNDGAVENASSTVMITGARPGNRGMYLCRASLGPSTRSSIRTITEVDVECKCVCVCVCMYACVYLHIIDDVCTYSAHQKLPVSLKNGLKSSVFSSSSFRYCLYGNK